MQQRPTGITVLAIVLIVGGVTLVAGGIGILSIPLPVVDPLTQLVVNSSIVVGLVLVLLGAAEIAVGWGMWSLREWARITTIVLFALEAVLNLVGGVALIIGVKLGGVSISFPGVGIALLLTALIQGVVIWYLSKPDVVSYFGVHGPSSISVVSSTIVSVPPPPPSPAPTVVPPSPPQPTEYYQLPPRPAAWLVARNGPQAGKNFGLKAGETTIGRDTRRADIVLDATTVSNEHARVRCEEGQFFLYDLASTNGTFINNRQIQKQMLRDGDVVRFGQAEFVFKSVS